MKAENSSTVSRRALIGSAVAVAVVAAGVTAAAPPSSLLDTVNDLLARRAANGIDRTNAEAAFSAAIDRLPWWAKPGLSHLLADGTLGGPRSGAPALLGVALPAAPSHRNIRPGAGTIRAEYKSLSDTGLGGEAGWRWRAVKQMQELRGRRRATRVAERKVGLPALNARLDALRAIEKAIDAGIHALPALLSDPAPIVAMLILAIAHHDIEPGADSVVAILKSARPSLSGLVALYADQVLSVTDDSPHAQSFGFDRRLGWQGRAWDA